MLYYNANLCGLVLPMFFLKLKTKTSKNPTLKRIEMIKLTRPVHVLKTKKRKRL